MEKSIYFSQLARTKPHFINNFLLSLISYDKVCCHVDNLFDILTKAPKQYHRLLLDIPELRIMTGFNDNDIKDYSLTNFDIKNYMDVYKPFIFSKGYSTEEYQDLEKKLIDKFTSFENANHVQDFFSKYLGELFIETEKNLNKFDILMDIYYTSSAKCNYIPTCTNDIIELNKNCDLRFDKNYTSKIFELNRFPDISESFESGDFNLEKFLNLRYKDGYKILKGIIFKEENFNNPDQLLKEYNDILLRNGMYKDRLKNIFWLLSNTFSFVSFIPGPVFSITGTLGSVATSNYKYFLKRTSDKVEDFLVKDLCPFIETLNRK